MTRPSAPIREPVGERLRRLRRERGISQRDLASPGVTAAYISRIEAGARTPSVKALRVLARKLGVSADYLETGIDVRPEDARELRLVDAELELRLTGDGPAVEPRFRSLLDEALEAGDAATEARARLGLAVVATRAGDHAEAIAHLEPALETGAVSPLAHADLYDVLAASYAAAGHRGRAASVLEDALGQARANEPRDAVAELRLATSLKDALADTEDASRAQGRLGDALAHAGTAADPLDRVRARWSHGRAAAEGGEGAAALGHFRRALGLLEALDETLQLARSHLAFAELLIDSGRGDDADTHLEHADRLLGPTAAATDAARLRAAQAARDVVAGATREAVKRAREALELLGDAPPAQRARTLRVLAEALAAGGEAEPALDAYRQATDLFERGGQLRDAAAVARTWAGVLRASGRETEALDVLERAADLATRAASARAF